MTRGVRQPLVWRAVIAGVGSLCATPLVTEAMAASVRRNPPIFLFVLICIGAPYVFTGLTAFMDLGRTAARLAIVLGGVAMIVAVLMAAILGLLAVWTYRPTEYLVLVLAIPANALLASKGQDALRKSGFSAEK